MTVSATQDRVSFAGDASTLTFSTNPMVFFDSTNLRVLVVDATGATTTLAVTTDYTVTGGDGSLGAVVTTGLYGTVAVGSSLVIIRDVPATQGSDLVNGGISDANVIERAFDRLTMVAQQVDAKADRAATLPDGYTGTAVPTLPIPSANKLIAWNSDATALENKLAADVGLTPVTAFMATVLDDSTAVAARTTLDVQQATNSLTAETAPAVADLLPMFDASAAAARKMTLVDLLKVITLLSSEASPAVDDELLLYDLSETAANKITLSNILKVINSLTEDTSPDEVADFLLSYDASAAAVKKVAPTNIRIGNLVLLDTELAASSATIDLTGITSAYEEYEVHLHNVVPATDNVALYLRTSTDGGSTFAASAGNYAYVLQGLDSGGTSRVANSSSATEIALAAAISSAATRGGYSGVVRFFNPLGTSHNKQFLANATFAQSATLEVVNHATGHRLATADVDAIRFLFASGNIASGRFVLYGVRRP